MARSSRSLLVLNRVSILYLTLILTLSRRRNQNLRVLESPFLLVGLARCTARHSRLHSEPWHVNHANSRRPPFSPRRRLKRLKATSQLRTHSDGPLALSANLGGRLYVEVQKILPSSIRSPRRGPHGDLCIKSIAQSAASRSTMPGNIIMHPAQHPLWAGL